MDLTSNIGIAVTGCKNGYALLATDGIDSSSELLRAALRDQRSYLRVTEPGHNYFILCVYRGTLVISACRSSVDAVGSSGGFIAVSLTVPPTLAINRPADLLTALLDEYWGEFMHPMFGSPLPGKLESAHRLRALLQDHAADVAPARVRYQVSNSKGAMPPLFMEFNSVADVNAVMSNPWHSAYMQGCELIMVPAGMLSSPKVNYNIEVKRVAPQRGMPGTAVGLLYPPKDSPVTVSSYAVNSKPCNSLGDVSLNADDIITLTMSLPDGDSRQFSCSVREAEYRRIIRREGDNYRLNSPTIDILLSISGALPAQGCEYALKSAQGEEVYGKPEAGNPLLWKFHIKCAAFPYSLVEMQGGRVKRVLCRDAVTPDRLANQPVPVIAEGKKPSPFGGGRIGEPSGPYGRKPKHRRLPMPIIASIAALLLGAIGLGAWLLWPSDTENQPKDPSDKGNVPITDKGGEKEDEETNSTSQDPKYSYLFIPVETLREFKSRNYDHLSSQAFPPGTGSYYDKKTKLTIIRIPEVKDQSINPVLGIYLEGAQEEKCGLIELNPTNMPEYEEFVNYLTSDQDRFLVRLSDPNKQPSTELVESINTMDLETLQYVPLDTTLPTEATSAASTSPQQQTPNKKAKKSGNSTGPQVQNNGKEKNRQYFPSSYNKN